LPAEPTIPTLPNEKELLRDLAAGHRPSYEQLYRHYYPSLHRYLFFITRSKEDAEEIIQDVFLKVWIKKETLTGVRSFSSYLFRMAKNRVFDQGKRTQQHHRAVSILRDSTPDTEDSSFANLLFSEYHAIALRAIDALPPRKKQIFLMNTRDELTAREIAERLGITRGAVKKQLYEATHFIREWLRKHAGWILPLLALLARGGAR
jgi:RNA polymerase sigma-70 factor (family 1)